MCNISIISPGTNGQRPSGAFSACARYKSLGCKIGQRSKPENRAHGCHDCLRHGETKESACIRSVRGFINIVASYLLALEQSCSILDLRKNFNNQFKCVIAARSVRHCKSIPVPAYIIKPNAPVKSRFHVNP